MKHGHGVYTFQNGSRYEGDWQDDTYNGPGTLTLPDQYIDDDASQRVASSAIIKYLSGDLYEGGLLGKQRNGFGVYRYASGAVYEGEYVDDVRNGCGKFQYSNHDVYEGRFKDGKHSGHGTYSYSNGDILSGEFREGVPHGKCTLTFHDGSVYTGTYVNARSTGVLTYVNGDVYAGDWLGNQKDGRGSLKSKCGETEYNGEWKVCYNYFLLMPTTLRSIERGIIHLSTQNCFGWVDLDFCDGMPVRCHLLQ